MSVFENVTVGSCFKLKDIFQFEDYIVFFRVDSIENGLCQCTGLLLSKEGNQLKRDLKQPKTFFNENFEPFPIDKFKEIEEVLSKEQPKQIEIYNNIVNNILNVK